MGVKFHPCGLCTSSGARAIVRPLRHKRTREEDKASEERPAREPGLGGRAPGLGPSERRPSGQIDTGGAPTPRATPRERPPRNEPNEKRPRTTHASDRHHTGSPPDGTLRTELTTRTQERRPGGRTTHAKAAPDNRPTRPQEPATGTSHGNRPQEPAAATGRGSGRGSGRGNRPQEPAAGTGRGKRSRELAVAAGRGDRPQGSERGNRRRELVVRGNDAARNIQPNAGRG